jgi:hypothetical protein
MGSVYSSLLDQEGGSLVALRPIIERLATALLSDWPAPAAGRPRLHDRRRDGLPDRFRAPRHHSQRAHHQRDEVRPAAKETLPNSTSSSKTPRITTSPSSSTTTAPGRRMRSSPGRYAGLCLQMVEELAAQYGGKLVLRNDGGLRGGGPDQGASGCEVSYLAGNRRGACRSGHRSTRWSTPTKSTGSGGNTSQDSPVFSTGTGNTHEYETTLLRPPGLTAAHGQAHLPHISSCLFSRHYRRRSAVQERTPRQKTHLPVTGASCPFRSSPTPPIPGHVRCRGDILLRTGRRAYPRRTARDCATTSPR